MQRLPDRPQAGREPGFARRIGTAAKGTRDMKDGTEMSHRNEPAQTGLPMGSDPGARVFALRWADGREERASGRNAAEAALSLGYGFDDFKNLTWEVRS